MSKKRKKEIRIGNDFQSFNSQMMLKNTNKRLYDLLSKTSGRQRSEMYLTEYNTMADSNFKQRIRKEKREDQFQM